MVAGAPIAVIPTPRSAWSQQQVFGLGDPVEEARVLDRPLSAWRPGARLLTDGGDGPLTGPLLLWGADLWVSPRMLRDFEARARALGRQEPVRLVRPLDGPAGMADLLGRLPRSQDGRQLLFDLWYLPEGVSLPRPTPDAPLPPELEVDHGLDIETNTHSVEIEVDRSVDPSRRMALRFAPVAAAPVGHWAELVRANQLAIGTLMLEAGPVVGVGRLLWAALKALVLDWSLNPFRVLARTTRRGRGCIIHPSAVVEGCTLGDGVKIDAHAVVRGCVLGDRVQIGALSVAEYSVFGHDARLQRQATANGSVIYPEARVGGVLQLGVAGRASTLKMGALGTDMNPDGRPVRVMTPEGLRPVDVGYHGVCLGHESFVGANLIIAPGRAIEAGRVVTSESRLVIRK